jgi:hypothetical protein
MEFYAENARYRMEKFQKLNEISNSICGFKTTSIFYFRHPGTLSEKGGNCISQPIKGTAKRFLTLKKMKIKIQLASDPKNDQKTITDLVRNDLSHTAQKVQLK